jgi:hypothetical protein
MIMAKDEKRPQNQNGEKILVEIDPLPRYYRTYKYRYSVLFTDEYGMYSTVTSTGGTVQYRYVVAYVPFGAIGFLVVLFVENPTERTYV